MKKYLLIFYGYNYINKHGSIRVCLRLTTFLCHE